MKRIMILNGAARKNGSTASLVKAFTEGAESAGNTVTEYYLQDMTIHGCLGCRACKKDAEPCAQHDDMDRIYEAFYDTDVVVFASPVYFGSITGPMKTAGDRLYALANTLGKEKFARDSVLLMTAGSPMYEQSLAWYAMYSTYNGWHDIGTVLGAGKEEEARALGVSIR